MNIFKKFWNNTKISKDDDNFISLLTLVSLNWAPMIVGLFFKGNIVGLSVSIVILLSIMVLLYAALRKIIDSKQLMLSAGRKVLYILILLSQNFIMLYLYIYKILTSKESLLLTVLVSLTIVFLCLAEAYYAKKRYQRKI